MSSFIFDYGGTLDTGGQHWGMRIWQAWQAAGVPVGWEQFREAYVYAERAMARERIVLPDFTFRDTLDAKLRLELEHAGGSSLNERYHAPVLDRLYEATRQATAESVAVLRELTGRKVLVSNFYGNIATVLHEFGFDGLFESIVESAVVGVRKPDPRIFELGVERLRMKPEDVTVVGDSYTKDIVPAKAAGCRTVWLRGEQWEGKEPESTCEADRIIYSIEELIVKSEK